MAGSMGEARAYPDGVVATPHYLATSAGLRVLADGGNALDAALAANLVLGVVTPYLCGYGGDVLAMVWDGALHGYIGAGRAPAAATVDGVRERAGADEMPVFGPHAVTVPGAPRGWFDLLERWGSRSFGDLATFARHYADDGFVLTRRGSQMFGGTRAILDHFDLHDFGNAYPDTEPGARVYQRALVRLIDVLANDGPDIYYKGVVADAIVAKLQLHGSFMTSDDLAGHTGSWVAPLRASFRGVEVAELPPPTQGVTALEALRIVDALDLGGDGPERAHLMIEAAKLALVDRNEYVGDPDTMPIPAPALIADEWIARRRAVIDPAYAATPAPDPGPDGGTAYLCAADRDGLLVSLIQTNFTAAGAGLHVGDWGINLHNRGSSFRLDPAHVNAMGSRKLAMHTLIPALALRDGRPWLAFGAMGGHTQAQTHLQMLVRMCVDGDDPQQAISAPRWAVDPDHWFVSAENRFDGEILDGLTAKGHDVRVGRGYDDRMGHAHAIELLEPGYRVATDPRAEGAAAGL
ncbi:MAG: gamma-glutamyltransferase family protein [Actinomycetota bacterium]